MLSRGVSNNPLLGHNPVTTYPVLTWDELFLIQQYETLPLNQLEILTNHEDHHDYPLLGWELQANDPVLPEPEEWELLQGDAIAGQAFMPEN